MRVCCWSLPVIWMCAAPAAILEQLNWILSLTNMFSLPVNGARPAVSKLFMKFYFSFEDLTGKWKPTHILPIHIIYSGLVAPPTQCPTVPWMPFDTKLWKMSGFARQTGPACSFCLGPGIRLCRTGCQQPRAQSVPLLISGHPEPPVESVTLQQETYKLSASVSKHHISWSSTCGLSLARCCSSDEGWCVVDFSLPCWGRACTQLLNQKYLCW